MDELPAISSFVTPILITPTQSEFSKNPPGYAVGLIIAGCVTSLVIVLYVLYKFHSTCCGWGAETTLTTSFTFSSDTKMTTVTDDPVWINVEENKFDLAPPELGTTLVDPSFDPEVITTHHHQHQQSPQRGSTQRRMTQAFLDAKQQFSDWKAAKFKPKPPRSSRGPIGLSESPNGHRRRSLFSRQEKYQISVNRLRDIIEA